MSNYSVDNKGKDRLDNNQNDKLSARNIWGRIIVYLREHQFIALHIACGDIYDVEMKDGKFIINTTENFLPKLLEYENNKNALTNAFKSVGIGDYEVIKKEKNFTKSQIDIRILKEIFKDDLEIEGD